MKKLISIMALLLTCTVFTGCSSCQSDKAKQENSKDYDGVAVDFNEGVEHIISLHRQTMNSIVKGKEYCWYETKIMFNEQLTLENIDDIKIVDVTDVFQTYAPDLCQYITTNAQKGTLIPSPTPGLWIEDFDMSDVEIKLTVNDVLQRLKEVNELLPPTYGLTLRKPVGPKECNAQYVLGNFMEVLFVDAVTGDVTNWCPAFPKD